MSKNSKFDPASKKTGLAHVFAATEYSIAGFKHLLKEAAFRQEMIIAAALLVVFWVAGVSAANFFIALCLMLITLSTEAINTAIELIADRTSPEISDYAKNAKDMGSFAVMCLLLANGIFAVYAIYTALI